MKQKTFSKCYYFSWDMDCKMCKMTLIFCWIPRPRILFMHGFFFFLHSKFQSFFFSRGSTYSGLKSYTLWALKLLHCLFFPRLPSLSPEKNMAANVMSLHCICEYIATTLSWNLHIHCFPYQHLEHFFNGISSKEKNHYRSSFLKIFVNAK